MNEIRKLIWEIKCIIGKYAIKPKFTLESALLFDNVTIASFLRDMTRDHFLILIKSYSDEIDSGDYTLLHNKIIEVFRILEKLDIQ